MFGIYVHFPFCRHRCSYCDFFSSTDYSDATFETYAASLIEEIRRESPLLKKRFVPGPVVSIFWGGGTPSLFPPTVQAKVVSALKAEWEMVADLEFTSEANPETVTDEKAAAWKSMGINRVSLGVQSTNQAALDLLDRQVSREAIPRAVGMLKNAGLDNFSCDLIFGIPGQSNDDVLADIDRIAELGPQHVSSYHLTLKPGHKLFKQLPDEERAGDLYEFVMDALEVRGFRQYEISNFAKPGKGSRHNRLYWSGGDFAGFGPSAAARFFKDGSFHHRKNVSDLKVYAEGRMNEFEATDFRATILESLFLELRKNEGVSLSHFRDRYGYDIAGARKFPLFVKEGLLERDADQLRLTRRGRLLADSVTPALLD